MRYLTVLTLALTLTTTAWAASTVCPKAFDGPAQPHAGLVASDLALLGPKTEFWTGDSALGAEAILSAREFRVFRSNNPKLGITYEYSREDYSEYSLRQPEVTQAVKRTQRKTLHYSNTNVGELDFNGFLRNFAAQISNPHQLKAFAEVMKVEKKTNISYLIEKGSFDPNSNEVGGEANEVGLRIADIGSRLRAALAITTPEQLASFESMNQSGRAAVYTARSESGNSSYTSGDARLYATNVQRYFILFAEHPEDHEVLAGMMKDGIPERRYITPEPHKFENQFATRAWSAMDVALNADAVLVNRIDYSAITSEKQLNAILDSMNAARERRRIARSGSEDSELSTEKLLRIVQTALADVPADPAPKVKGSENRVAKATAPDAPAAASDPAAPTESQGWFTRFRTWLNN